MVLKVSADLEHATQFRKSRLEYEESSGQASVDGISSEGISASQCSLFRFILHISVQIE